MSSADTCDMYFHQCVLKDSRSKVAQMQLVSDEPKEKTFIPRSHPCQIMKHWARCVEMYPSAKHPSKKPTVRPTYGRWTNIEPIDRARCLEMSTFWFFFCAHAVRARGSDGHTNVLFLKAYPHLLENR